MSDEDVPVKINKKITHGLARLEKEQRILRSHESDRSVFEEVFDRATLMTLYDIMNEHIFTQLNGVVASGKESRIYWGITPEKSSVAVKIYLVTSAEFRQRRQYIVGDPRFGNVKGGIRNLVNLWARKEFKNLMSAYEAGVLVPKPIRVKSNVLIMEFIGKKGVPAPTLNQCDVTWRHYKEALNSIKDLYAAELVHADLSEYNIFLYEGKLMLFDFGSAVSTAHPHAEQFLIRDISNINKFFEKRGIDAYGLDKALKVVKQN